MLSKSCVCVCFGASEDFLQPFGCFVYASKFIYVRESSFQHVCVCMLMFLCVCFIFGVRGTVMDMTKVNGVAFLQQSLAYSAWWPVKYLVIWWQGYSDHVRARQTAINILWKFDICNAVPCIFIRYARYKNNPRAREEWDVKNKWFIRFIILQRQTGAVTFVKLKFHPETQSFVVK